MFDETTTRLDLPLLQPGQAQKEMIHNEALARIDAALGACVIADAIDLPPAAPQEGDGWIVGSAPTGAWAGQAGSLAVWTIGGWRFVVPFEGFSVWHRTRALTARYSDGTWRIGEARATRLLIDGVPVVAARRGAISNPSGGGTADQPARDAIGAILAAMRAHGLIAS